MTTLAQKLEQALSNPDSVTRLELRGSEGDRLDELPPDVGRLTALEHLDISQNALKALPQEIENLALLGVLDARSNRLETMPSFKKLEKLREAYFGRNVLTAIDKHFAWMKRLERFEAHGNKIRYIPPGFHPSALVDLQLGDNDFSLECAPHCGFVWTPVRMMFQHRKLTRLGLDASLLGTPDYHFQAAKKLRALDVYGDGPSDGSKEALAALLPKKAKIAYGLAKADGPRLEPLK